MKITDFIKLVWQYLEPHKKLTWFCIFLITTASVISAFIPKFYGRLVDIATQPNVDLGLVAWILGLWFLFVLFSNWIGRFVDYQSSFLGFEVHKSFLVDIYAHYLQLPISFHKEKRSGEQLQKISQSAGFLWQTVGDTIFFVLPAFLSAIVVLVLIFIAEWRLALLLTLIFVFYTIVTIKKVKPIVKARRRVSKFWEVIWGDMHDAVRNIDTVKACVKEEEERKNTVYNLERITKPLKKLWLGFRSMDAWQNNIQGLGFVIVFGLALYFLIQKEITAGLLVSFIGYVNLAFRPFNQLSGNYRQIEQGLVTVGRAVKLLEIEKELYGKGKKIKEVKGQIEFKNISFGYGDNLKNVLRGISFKAEAGQMVALVGESGTGKTTLLSLISRYYELKTGKIFLDGMNINELDLIFLRSQIALVSQEISLFNDTLKNNLLYAKKNASEEEIIKALEAANAWEFVNKFPKKINQKVGERGIKLSTGQKQRIAIARAILRNPKILILDEATSALDSISERLVQEALKRLIAGRTTFVIAHRLSTIVHADKILVFDKGQLVEQGKHEELVAQGGVYAKLYKEQKF
ncbi:MAG: ABC transporter ATP-binding protein [Patescibacteria group bacterium]|nr:ABC transporter ATP-binding protein [Patescibacteria group bacterium]